MKETEAILDVLTSQRFSDWYNGKFEDFITGDLEYEEDITHEEAKKIILEEIDDIFKLSNFANGRRYGTCRFDNKALPVCLECIKDVCDKWEAKIKE